MVIPNEVLNAMDADELRAYICKLEDVDERMGDMNFARSEIIEALELAYNRKDYEMNCGYRLDCARGNLTKYAEEMMNKYNYVLPTPVCGKECRNGNGSEIGGDKISDNKLAE